MIFRRVRYLISPCLVGVGLAFAIDCYKSPKIAECIKTDDWPFDTEVSARSL